MPKDSVSSRVIVLFCVLVWVSLIAPSRVESVYYSSFSCNPLLYWKSVGVVVRCGGGQEFYKLMINLQPFSGLVSLGCDHHKYFLNFSLFR